MSSLLALWKHRTVCGKTRRKEKAFFCFFCLAVGLISQREGRNGSERDKDGSHVCTGWEMTYSAEIKFILLVKKVFIVSDVLIYLIIFFLVKDYTQV